MVDKKLNKKADVKCENCYTLELLKRTPQEVYLYSRNMLIRVTHAVVEKPLYSDCGALFLDTSNQVILYDRYQKKFINVSKLPGF